MERRPVEPIGRVRRGVTAIPELAPRPRVADEEREPDAGEERRPRRRQPPPPPDDGRPHVDVRV